MSTGNDKQYGTIYDGKENYDDNEVYKESKLNKTVLLLILFSGLLLTFISNRAIWFFSLKNSIISTGYINYVQNLDVKVNEVKIKDLLLREARKTNRNLTVLNVLPKFERMRLFVFSKQNNIFTSIGPFSFRTQAGINEIKLYGPDIIKFSWYGNYQFLYFGNSIMNPFFSWYNDFLKKSGPAVIANNLREPEIGVSYQKPQFKIIFSIYFFLPLILIILLGLRFGKIMYLSVVYYGVMAIFFNIKHIFYLGTFSWITNLIEVEITPFMEFVSVIIVVSFLTALFVRGLIEVFKGNFNFEKICFVLFFMIMPLMLRF